MSFRSPSRVKSSRFDDWKPYPRLPLHVENEGLCHSAPLAWFFPHRGMPAIGKTLCEQCEAVGPCLDFALDNKISYGVWGGMSERERLAERRRRLEVRYTSGEIA